MTTKAPQPAPRNKAKPTPPPAPPEPVPVAQLQQQIDRLTARIQDLTNQMTLTAMERREVIKSWQGWHHQLAQVLECEFVERRVTLGKAKTVMAELRRRQAGESH